MIELGAKVTDSMTGFEGVVIARVEYLNGCVSLEVQPESLGKEGSPLKPEWFDEQRLDAESKVTVGGPGDTPPSHSMPDEDFH